MLTESKRIGALLESAKVRFGVFTSMRNLRIEQTAADAGMARKVRGPVAMLGEAQARASCAERRAVVMLEEAQARASRAVRRAEACTRATAHVSAKLTPADACGLLTPCRIRLAPAPFPGGPMLGPVLLGQGPSSG